MAHAPEDRLFDRIKTKLGSKVFEAKLPKWDRKRYSAKAVDTLAKPDNARKTLESISSDCDRFLHTRDAFTKMGSRGKIFGELRKVLRPANKKEEVLERLLAAADEELYNRFNFLSGIAPQGEDATTRSMTVDLVKRGRSIEKVIAEFIELKEGGNKSDSPLSALVEVLMYYYLYVPLSLRFSKQLPPLKSQFSLVVLAPTEYYNYWEFTPGGDKCQELEKCINCALHKTKPRIPNTRARISFRVIDLTRNAIAAAVDSLKIIRASIK
jgi:hypothetical protein